ncbi:hypothetical protein AcW2_006438 [Taiwanofungus camphoratus]|nr:hypothetical protein AcW2_006438 [Antrodia cinnamomea]
MLAPNASCACSPLHRAHRGLHPEDPFASRWQTAYDIDAFSGRCAVLPFLPACLPAFHRRPCLDSAFAAGGGFLRSSLLTSACGSISHPWHSSGFWPLPCAEMRLRLHVRPSCQVVALAGTPGRPWFECRTPQPTRARRPRRPLSDVRRTPALMQQRTPPCTLCKKTKVGLGRLSGTKIAQLEFLAFRWLNMKQSVTGQSHTSQSMVSLDAPGGGHGLVVLRSCDAACAGVPARFLLSLGARCLGHAVRPLILCREHPWDERARTGAAAHGTLCAACGVQAVGDRACTGCTGPRLWCV